MKKSILILLLILLNSSQGMTSETYSLTWKETHKIFLSPYLLNEKNIFIKGSESIKELILKSEREFFRIAGASAIVGFENGSTNYFAPGKGIILGTRYLEKKQRSYNKETFQFIIYFLLAHELAHKIQYDSLGNKLMTPYCEKKMLYECQADIIAGAYLERLYKFEKKSKLYSEDLYKNALSFIYDIGENEDQLDSHPSHLERRNAVRSGIDFEIFNSGSTHAQTIRDRLFVKDSPSNHLFKWSINYAKYTIHFPRYTSKYLIYLADEDSVKWDTSAANPIVSYRSRFINISKESLKLFVQFKLIGVSRSSEDVRDINSQGDVSNKQMIIKPGDTVEFKGVLRWANVSTKIKMPRFVSIPDPESLYCVEPLKENEDEFHDCGPGNLSSQESIAGHQSIESILTLLNSASIQNFNDFKYGVPTISPGDKQVTYNTRLKLNDGYDLSIYQDIPVGKNTATLTIYDGDDESKAQNAFNALLAALADLRTNNIIILKDNFSSFTFGDPEKYQVEKKTVLVTKTKGRIEKSIYGKFKLTKLCFSASMTYNTIKRGTSIDISFDYDDLWDLH